MRQRRVRADDAGKLERGERVVRTRFGVDDEICHRRSLLHPALGLSVAHGEAESRPAAETDPVATVVESCVGCGLCGEVAHAAVLCPSFYRVELIRNPTRWDRLRDGPSAGATGNSGSVWRHEV